MDPVSRTEEKSIPVKITVIRGNNLRGSKPDSLEKYVRVEFNGAVLGDSPREKSVSVEQSVDYHFTCSFQCSTTTLTLDDVAHKPVILTVVEILPKEKKQKEEKTAVLGQATLDLLPLLHGQVSYSTTVLLHPVPVSPGEAVSQEGSNKQPCLDVSVSVPEPLLSEAQLLSSNLLKVTVETAYSVPEEWNLAPGSGPPPSTYYIAALQVPLTAEKEQVLLFSNGLLKADGDRETLGRPRKWPVAPLLAPGAQILPGGSIEVEPIEQEDGELTSIEDREFRNTAESTGTRVSWDTERRCHVDAGGAASLSRRIGESRLWPVEIMRSFAQGAKGGKAGRALAEDDFPYHGVAYVDMGPLLYPGVTRIRGAYRVHLFSEAELLAKAKRAFSMLKEHARAHPTLGRAGQTGSSMGVLKAAPSRVLDGGQKGGKDIKETPRKPGAQRRPSGANSATEVETQVNPEGQVYADAKTYIIIEVALRKPLVPKRPPEELAKRVMELIPPRPPLPRRPAGAERAVQEFHNQVASVVGQLLEQYQERFGPAFLPGAKPLDPRTQEQRKTQLLGELNYSGKYLAFKEQLKYSVVRMVREKMLRTEAFSDPEQLRAFLSQLYVFLVDHMHLALNKTLSIEAHEAPERPLLDCSQLRHFSREAQLTGDYQLAAQYHQERVSREPTEPSHWFDYGSFYMLTGEHLKAEECYHRAVSIQQSHHPSLMMSGILAEMAGRYEEAQSYLEGATCIDPTSVVAWTLFGLFLEGQNNSIQAEMAFLEAARQLRAILVVSPPSLGAEDTAGDPQLEEEQPEEEEAKAACQSPSVRPESLEEEGDEKREPDGESVARGSERSQSCRNKEDYKADPGSAPARPSSTIYMETVQFLLHNNALQMAQRALSQELLVPEGGLTSCYHVALARLYLARADYCSATASLKAALNDSFQDPDVWALYGHCHYLTGECRRARKCYERSLDFVKDASDTHPVYLRLGSIYLQEGKFESAKMIYLRACKSSPSCLTWLGLGIACYRLGDLTEAEDALSEANSLNNMNPEVWGYLALVCLKSGRRLEAEQSYKYVIKLNLQKESILREIKELQDQFGFGNPCF